MSDGRSRVGFVMAGGALRGAAQVGMLQALATAGVRADLVVGTSVGALNGAVYAQGPTADGVDRLAEMWIDPPRSQIFDLSARSIAQNVWHRPGHFLENRGMRSWIESHVERERLEDFPVPLHVVATEAASGRPVVLSEGDTVEALLATSAIPGVFPSVVIDGTVLHDGAASANTPTRQAIELGATTIYVLPTLPSGPVDTSPFWTLVDRVVGRPAPPEELGDLDGIPVCWLQAPRPPDNPVTFRESRRLIDEARDLNEDLLRPERLLG